MRSYIFPRKPTCKYNQINTSIKRGEKRSDSIELDCVDMSDFFPIHNESTLDISII